MTSNRIIFERDDQGNWVEVMWHAGKIFVAGQEPQVEYDGSHVVLVAGDQRVHMLSGQYRRLVSGEDPGPVGLVGGPDPDEAFQDDPVIPHDGVRVQHPQAAWPAGGQADPDRPLPREMGVPDEAFWC